MKGSDETAQRYSMGRLFPTYFDTSYNKMISEPVTDTLTTKELSRGM